MTSNEIRQAFLDFFKSKGHEIVPSAPIVVKNDPTLMFTNAGMNQFKDYFLGNKKPVHTRIADTQKCLRVSGKHNDLEEVGVDTYHHTMFEMLGNWSFGDYFKKEAIAWSWELLTEVYKLDKSRLYVTIFEGDAKEGLPKDEEAYNEWKKVIAEDRILLGNKKDNFWEMGDTGPCGPCTEIHVDCRTDDERKAVDGKTLVNNDHPQVIEIWNNVFIQFNRKKDGSLEPLPAKHVDTGMGLERLVRVLQGKTSNYDTDIFSGTISEVEKITGKKYDYSDTKEAIAFRVLADHIRAISFTIADGQLPSNTGAGYVIRRILRRAVRYYFSYLDYKQPLLTQLVPVLARQFEHVFPELQNQVDFVSKVVKEEEDAFLRTLGEGIKLFNIEVLDGIKNNIELIKPILESKSFIDQSLSKDLQEVLNNIGEPLKNALNSLKENGIPISEALKIAQKINFSIPNIIKKPEVQNTSIQNVLNSISGSLQIPTEVLKGFTQNISGSAAFKLQDTFGFPKDLTKLLAKEINIDIDENSFEEEMQRQKDRSRAATTLETEDWVTVNDGNAVTFVGYNDLNINTKVLKYRKVAAKGKEQYQIVLETTPFYAESGGQVGDTGSLFFGEGQGEVETIEVTDTKKENDLIIHFTNSLPKNINAAVNAVVNYEQRLNTMYNHTATHLLHAALRKVLGNHVAQKGSLVAPDVLRFDVSHFAKITDEELNKVQVMVNDKIRENIAVQIKELPKEEAMKLGAMALFGEKYGDVVRVVTVDPNYSIELCGGTHVPHTGMIGMMLITSEAAVAAGVRRIEAITGPAAFHFISEKISQNKQLGEVLKSNQPVKAIEKILADKAALEKRVQHLEAKELVGIRNELLQKVISFPFGEGRDGAFIGDIVEVSNADNLKKLCSDLKSKLHDYVAVLCANIDGKPFVAVGISDTVVAAKNLDAGKIIKEHIAPLIKGGGGGQKTLATAGGQDAGNLIAVIEKVKSLL